MRWSEVPRSQIQRGSPKGHHLWTHPEQVRNTTCNPLLHVSRICKVIPLYMVYGESLHNTGTHVALQKGVQKGSILGYTLLITTNPGYPFSLETGISSIRNRVCTFSAFTNSPIQIPSHFGVHLGALRGTQKGSI